MGLFSVDISTAKVLTWLTPLTNDKIRTPSSLHVYKNNDHSICGLLALLTPVP